MADGRSSARQLQSSKSGMRMVAPKSSEKSPFELEEPPWTPDGEALACCSCGVKFDVFSRRHHCRRCGKCFCNTCCHAKIMLPRLAFVDPVRVCEPCLALTTKENEFYFKFLKLLTTGAKFLVKSTAQDDPEQANELTCKLTSNHRYLAFEGLPSSSLTNVEFVSIESCQVHVAGVDPTGNASVVGISVKYKDSHAESQSVTLGLLPAGATDAKDGAAWIAALQKAVKMFFESRSARRT